MKRFIVLVLGGMVAFGGSIAAEASKCGFNDIAARSHALADLAKLHTKRPLSRLAGNCPCRTSTGACRYDDNGRPASNC